MTTKFDLTEEELKLMEELNELSDSEFDDDFDWEDDDFMDESEDYD